MKNRKLNYPFQILTYIAIILCCNNLIYAQSDIDKLNAPLIKITETVMPTIVHLRVKKEIPRSKLSGNKRSDLFDEFFKDPLNRPPVITEMVGSGVIVSPKGYVVTNNHVIENAIEIKVILDNNEEYAGEIIGTDKLTDLAVIRFKSKNGSFKVARLGDSEKLKVGEIVLALGSPFGLRKSVTQGIVSAKGRKNALGFGVNFIQTDAAINPGNSGGALVNMKGEVIGINSLILARSANPQTAGFQGIGLAIPINLVKKVMKQIIKNGRVIRGFLGVRPANINENMSKSLKVIKGVLINVVILKSPASKAGLKPWDLIVQINNKEVKDFDHLRNIIADTPVGEEIYITYIRNNKKLKTKVAVGDFDKFNKLGRVKEKNKKKKPKIDIDDPTLGLEIKLLTREERKILSKEFKVNYGVLVLKVKGNSVASKTGIAPGDVLLEVEGTPIKSPATFHAAIKKYRANRFFRLRLIKRGQFFIIPVAF